MRLGGAIDGVEHRLDDPLGEAVLLPVVHHDHLNIRECFALTLDGLFERSALNAVSCVL